MGLNQKLHDYNVSLEKEVSKRTKELTQIADKDSITGLLNRSSFDRNLAIFS